MHATETQLALFDTGELGLFERYRVRWHVSGCERCREDLAAFEEARMMLQSEAAAPVGETGWERLAAEMTANIRLGVEAGECVRPATVEAKRTPFSWQPLWRPGLAVAGVVAALYGGTWFVSQQMGKKSQARVEAAQQVVLEARPDALEIRSNGAAFSLIRASAGPVSVGMGRSLEAQEVDEDTGQVTIYHVYAQ